MKIFKEAELEAININKNIRVSDMIIRYVDKPTAQYAVTIKVIINKLNKRLELLGLRLETDKKIIAPQKTLPK